MVLISDDINVTCISVDIDRHCYATRFKHLTLICCVTLKKCQFNWYYDFSG